ncbi:MAG: hypothetical protein AAF549_04890 [Pseudomonadota bacterium]
MKHTLIFLSFLIIIAASAVAQEIIKSFDLSEDHIVNSNDSEFDSTNSLSIPNSGIVLKEVQPNQGEIVIDDFSNSQKEKCNFEDWVGRILDEKAVEATRRPYRIVRKDMPMTEEYIYNRINVFVDDDDIVESVTCG